MSIFVLSVSLSPTFLFVQPFVVGSYLHSADVGLAAMTQQVDPMVVKGALFDTMLNFETDAEILHRYVYN